MATKQKEQRRSALNSQGQVISKLSPSNTTMYSVISLLKIIILGLPILKNEAAMPASSAEPDIAMATRRSIKKLFPMGPIMASGNDNPITLHAVNANAFAMIWSLIAETMVVQIELTRSTKEAVATLVSERNSCPVCIKAHEMMGTTAIVVEKNAQSKDEKKADDKQKQHDQAIQYAELLLSDMKQHKRTCGEMRPSSSSDSAGSGSASSSTKKRKRMSKKFSHLNAAAKAEVALVVMLFDHMNRVVSVIMGEEMSTAMFSVPRSLARAMERPSAIKVMSRMMAPLLSGAFKAKNAPGVTLDIFPNETAEASVSALSKDPLPENLQGVLLAGFERANAVGRLVNWVKVFEKEHLIKNYIISRQLVSFLDRQTQLTHEGVNFESPKKVAEWIDDTMKTQVDAELLVDVAEDEVYSTERCIAMVLLMASFAPQTAYASKHWDDLVDRVGVSMARSIVIWWSLRTTFKDAKGLDEKIDKSRMVALMTGALEQ